MCSELADSPDLVAYVGSLKDTEQAPIIYKVDEIRQLKKVAKRVFKQCLVKDEAVLRF
jgi:hypothetical protein